MELDCDQPLTLCHEVGFYPIDPGGSLKGEPGFSQESDVCSPALCFKMFLLVAGVGYGLLKEDACGRTQTRREVTRKPPWDQRKELPNASGCHGILAHPFFFFFFFFFNVYIFGCTGS